uniref:Superoxide dismutase [Cu-Zn] n=1 Tax=Pyramimonas obovata TaxID=1411642 RepID=A0A7S0RTN0_9CHLO
MAAFTLSASLIVPTVATRTVSKKTVAQKMAAPLRAGSSAMSGRGSVALKAPKVAASTRSTNARRGLQIVAAYPIKAICEVGPKGKPCGGGEEKAEGCVGTITLTQTSPDSTTIEWDIKNCGTGLHGFHIHEKADFSDGCMSAGPHYNPFGLNHGGPDDEVRHVGDLGNIEGAADGNSKGSMTDRLVKLEGEYSVIGRSMMVHEDPDDLGTGDHSEPGTNGKTSLTTGNAGARIACGEITLC